MYFPVASSNPDFLASTNPWFSLLIIFILLSFLLYSLHIFKLLSVDPSLTNINSKFLYVCSNIEYIHLLSFFSILYIGTINTYIYHFPFLL